MLRRFRTPALSEARLASLLADANTRAAGGAPIVSVSSENSYYIEGEPGLDPSSPALSWLLSETFEPQCYGEATFLDEVRDGAARWLLGEEGWRRASPLALRFSWRVRGAGGPPLANCGPRFACLPPSPRPATRCPLPP